MKGTVKRREQWRPVLDAEVMKWSAKSYEQLLSELKEEQVYEVVFNGKNHQVEVALLENTDEYLHVCVSVDDGTLPASFRPISSSFVRQKPSRKAVRTANDEQRTTSD